MKDIANFLFETGMLQKTPRSGFQFLGSGCESVASIHFEQSYRLCLCKLDPEVDESRVMKLCLIHDLPETRTGDMNYVNKKYVDVDENKAVNELAKTLFFGEELRCAINEFNEKKTRESIMAHDADQLALILQLKEYGDLGNKYSKEWIDFAVKRLCTDTAKTLATAITETDSSEWWFKDKVTGG